MKITFLGTSHGVPSAERFCTSLMVEVREKIYLLDAGAPISDLLRRKERALEAVRAIFITHGHGDHIGGLPGFLSLSNWHDKQVRVKTYLPDPKLLQEVPAYIEATDLKPLDQERLPLYLAKEGVVYEDEAIRVSYIKTAHLPYSYAILVEGEGKKFLFTGDLSHGLAKDDFPKIAMEQPLDVIVCEMAHFGAEEIQPYLEKIDVKQFWFTHVNHVETGEKFDAIRKMQGKYPYPVYIAKDNDEIHL